MPRLSEIRSETLRNAFLRDEIPEVMVWLRNDGIERVDPETLDRYVSGEGTVGPERIDPLVTLGLLRRSEDGLYELTDAGVEHGSQVLDHHFADLDKLPKGPVLCACGCCGELPEPGGVEGLAGVAAGASS